MTNTTKTSQTIVKLKSAASAAMVKAVWANSTVAYHQELATAALYHRIAKMV